MESSFDSDDVPQIQKPGDGHDVEMEEPDSQDQGVNEIDLEEADQEPHDIPASPERSADLGNIYIISNPNYQLTHNSQLTTTTTTITK